MHHPWIEHGPRRWQRRILPLDQWCWFVGENFLLAFTILPISFPTRNSSSCFYGSRTNQHCFLTDSWLRFSILLCLFLLGTFIHYQNYHQSWDECYKIFLSLIVIMVRAGPWIYFSRVKWVRQDLAVDCSLLSSPLMLKWWTDRNSPLIYSCPACGVD